MPDLVLLAGDGRGRGGARGVLELLLRSEDPIKNGLARSLGKDQRSDPAEDREHEQLPSGVAAAPLAPELLARLLKRVGSRAKLLLELLVLHQRPRRPLAV